MNIHRGPPRSLALCLTPRGTRGLLLVHEGSSCCLGTCSLGRPLRTGQTVHLRVSVCLSFIISPPAKNTCNLLSSLPGSKRPEFLKPTRYLRGCGSQPRRSVTSGSCFPFLSQSECPEQRLKQRARSQTLQNPLRAFPLPGSKPSRCLPLTTCSHELEPCQAG